MSIIKFWKMLTYVTPIPPTEEFNEMMRQITKKPVIRQLGRSDGRCDEALQSSVTSPDHP